MLIQKINIKRTLYIYVNIMGSRVDIDREREDKREEGQFFGPVLFFGGNRHQDIEWYKLLYNNRTIILLVQYF